MIVNVQEEELPEASVDWKPTTFTPSGKDDPLGRPRICTGLAEPEQLSGANGHMNIATAVQVFGSVSSTWSSGQVVTGGVTSTEYASITQEADKLAPSVTVTPQIHSLKRVERLAKADQSSRKGALCYCKTAAVVVSISKRGEVGQRCLAVVIGVK